MLLSNLRLCLWLFTLLLAATHVRADALDEMLHRLQDLIGQTPVTAHLQAKVKHQLGKDEDANIRAGEASVRVHQNNSGLRFYYSPELLAQMAHEQEQHAQDPDVQTPVLTAIDELQPVAVKRMLSATSSLLRLVESSHYEGVQMDSFAGEPARRLTFSYGLERVSEREKKYVKKYQSQVHVWIDAQGTPLASHHFTRLSGSAFIIIRFKSSTDDYRHYQRYGDRLLLQQRTYASSASGAGEFSAFNSEQQLSLIGREDVVE